MWISRLGSNSDKTRSYSESLVLKTSLLACDFSLMRTKSNLHKSQEKKAALRTKYRTIRDTTVCNVIIDE